MCRMCMGEWVIDWLIDDEEENMKLNYFNFRLEEGEIMNENGDTNSIIKLQANY